MPDLARRLLRARRQRRLVVPVRVPGRAGALMAGGGLLPTGPGLVGKQTFDTWLLEQAGRAMNERRDGSASLADSGEQTLAERFTASRARLVRVAYAILGSYSEAEDVVADAWPRLAAADANEPIRDVDAWSTVTVARAALDAYRSARRRREVYVGPWLPEPLVGEAPAADPADRVTLDDTVSFALLVVLEIAEPGRANGLGPARLCSACPSPRSLKWSDEPRMPSGSSPPGRARTCRIAPHGFRSTRRSISRRSIAFWPRRPAVGSASWSAILDPQVTLVSDGGGVVSAARHPIHGADRVARFLIGIAAQGRRRRRGPAGRRERLHRHRGVPSRVGFRASSR